jgi:hypothetical protein
MIRILASLALGLICATHASAANIRSGEHADFSRLVVQFDDTFDWSFGRTDTGYMLRSRGLDAAIDTSRIFDLIPRDRIVRVDLNRAAGELRLEVSCPCHGDAFEIRAGRVVIDIKDGPAPASSPFEQVLTQDEPGSTPGPDVDDVATGATVEPVKPREAAPVIAPPFDTADFKMELVAGLSRAMTQGLVSPGFSLEQLARSPEPAPSEQPGETAPEVVAQDPPMASVGSNALTQVELDRLERFLADPVAELSRCARFRDLDFALDDENPIDVIQAQRARLYDPVGRLSEAVAFDLAVAYLSMGFGAEALEILNVVDQSDPRTPVFKAIGAILEQQPIRDENPFWGQIECRGGYVIWEILSRDTPSRLDAEHLRGIQLHFLELPKELRRRIGPDLGVKLAEAGYLEVAQVIRNSLVRAETQEFLGLRSLDASMALETGDPAGAIRNLEDIVLQNGPEAPDALLDLFASYTENGVVAPDQFRNLLSSYRFELQGSPLGRSLALLEIELLVRDDNLADAMLAISDFESEERRLTDGENGRLLALALDTTSDLIFARFALDRRGSLEASSISPGLFEDVMARLVSSNFLEVSERIAGSSALRSPDILERVEAMQDQKRSSVLLALEAQ